MREMRRNERRLSREEAVRIAATCEYAAFSTVGADGAPYCVPVSPVWSGEFMYFHCAIEGEKLDNIAGEPRVCLACVGETRLVPERFTTLYESAVVRGKAELVEDPQEKIAVLRLIGAKYAASNLGNLDSAIDKSLHRTGIVRIRVEEITGKAKRPRA